MTNVATVTYVVFVIPAGAEGVEAICPALHCSAKGQTSVEAIEAMRMQMSAALRALKAAGREPPVESGYAVAEEMEDRLRRQDESGLPISMATHEVTVGLD